MGDCAMSVVGVYTLGSGHFNFSSVGKSWRRQLPPLPHAGYGPDCVSTTNGK